MVLACGGRTSVESPAVEPPLVAPGTGGQVAGSGGVSGTGGKGSGGLTGAGGRTLGTGGTVDGSGGIRTGGAPGLGGRTIDSSRSGEGGGDAGNVAGADGPRPFDVWIMLGPPDLGRVTALESGAERSPVEAGLDRPLLSSDAAIDLGVVPCNDGGGETCAAFCAAQPSAGVLVCDDFSGAMPAPPRELVPWDDMPSLAVSVSGSALVLEDPRSFSACSLNLGPEMDFRDTAIEVTMSATTEARSLSAVSWGTPTNLINAGLQRDEHALYLHFVVDGVLLARLSSPIDMAPGQSQRVRMEVRATGLIQCFVDDRLVLSTTEDLSRLPRTLAPGVHANAYPPEQRFTFDDFVVRKLAQP
jgi:hypothetical protein